MGLEVWKYCHRSLTSAAAGLVTGASVLRHKGAEQQQREDGGRVEERGAVLVHSPPHHHTIPCYWGTIVTVLTPVYCILTSAVPGVPARCGDYIALEHLSLALIGTHHVHISGGGCSLDKPETTLAI